MENQADINNRLQFALWHDVCGVYTSNADHIIISNNRFSDIDCAIYHLGSSWGTITNNIFENNDCAIDFHFSSNNNEISLNQISNNNYGIYLSELSNDNLIHHNDFVNNVLSATTMCSGDNLWDDGSEGNYWDDYPGSDLDGDGIGDTPYIISDLYGYTPDSKDRYPLMDPVVV